MIPAASSPVLPDAPARAGRSGAHWVRRLSLALALAMVASIGVAAPAHAHHVLHQVQNGFEANQPAWQFFDWAGGGASPTTAPAAVRSGSRGASMWAYEWPGFQGGQEARLTVNMPWQPGACDAAIWMKNPTGQEHRVRFQAISSTGHVLRQVTFYIPPTNVWYNTRLGVLQGSFTPPQSSFIISLTLLMPQQGSPHMYFDDLTAQCTRAH